MNVHLTDNLSHDETLQEENLNQIESKGDDLDYPDVEALNAALTELVSDKHKNKKKKKKKKMVNITNVQKAQNLLEAMENKTHKIQDLEIEMEPKNEFEFFLLSIYSYTIVLEA